MIYNVNNRIIKGLNAINVERKGKNEEDVHYKDALSMVLDAIMKKIFKNNYMTLLDQNIEQYEKEKILITTNLEKLINLTESLTIENKYNVF